MNHNSIIFSKYLSDEAMAAVVSDETLIGKMLEFEKALSKAQAKLQMIPELSAIEIEKLLNKINISPADLTEGTLNNGVPVVTFVSVIKKQLPASAQNDFHFGATSQDVMDTANILILKDALLIITARLQKVVQQLETLLKNYGDVPCMARTRGQLAMPTFFSTKINAWLLPLKRQQARCGEISKTLFLLQLGGAVGDRGTYKDKGEILAKEVAMELGLTPALPWHSQRDNLCEFGNWLAMLTSVLGKMGADLLVMAQSEIEEIEESTEGGGRSSVMPHKRNPVLSEALVAIAKINATLQSQLLLSMLHTNERDATAWILEWVSFPQMLIYAATSLRHAQTILSQMKLNTATMQKNVEQFKRGQNQ